LIKLERPTQLSQHEPVGNTSATDSKTTNSNNQCYRWAFTLKCEPNDPGTPGAEVIRGTTSQDLACNLKSFCKEFYFQLEESESGYLHFQGCFSLTVKHRLSEVKNIIGYSYVHLETVKNWTACKKYCQKEDTRVLGPWDHNSVWLHIITELYPWQQAVVDMIKTKCEDDRKIYWLYDEIGGMGKTAFTKYCNVTLGASIIRGGALKDIAFSLPESPKIVIFDITRSQECRVNYEALEAVKDGMIFSAKYESRMKVFDSPWMIVLANFAPDKEMLSADRWEIINLREV